MIDGLLFENHYAKQPIWGICPDSFSKQNNGIIICSRAQVGSSQELDGKTYTKIDDRFDLIKFNGTVDATQACTSDITDMMAWFAGIADFDKDISHWDTSSVTEMGYIFNDATVFNQDLSNWCVKKILTKPTNFDVGAGFENYHIKTATVGGMSQGCSMPEWLVFKTGDNNLYTWTTYS